MQIEKGKFYRTRDGRRVEIYSTDNPGPFTVHGRVISDTSEGNRAATFTPSGNYRSGREMADLDIISEWHDEPVVDWSLYSASTEAIAMDCRGEWHEYNSVPVLRSTWCLDSNLTGPHCQYPIKPQFAPKFTGDWKDSLVIRPKK